MRKKSLSLLLAALLLALCSSTEAQQPKKVFRIGYLSGVDPTRESARSEAFRVALHERGYIEGQNIAIEYRYAEGKNDRLPGLASELVDLKVDIIVGPSGSAPIRAAKNATRTIPIVTMSLAADPVEAGFVESLARPGGNITGLTLLFRELGGKRLELLKEAVPKLDTVAVPYDPTNSVGALEVKNVLPVTARALGWTLQPREVRAEDGFEKVFAALTKQRPDGLYAHPTGPLIFANQKRLATFALQSRIPSVYFNREAVDAGGLMYYGADFADSYRRVAYYVTGS